MSGRLFSSNENCGDPPANAEPYSVDRVPWMVGSFRLTLVRTSFDTTSWSAELNLVAIDSATRARAREQRLGHWPRRDFRLGGVRFWDRRRSHESVELDDGILYLGCRDCNDGSPDKLRIRAVTENGFWGSWVNDQSGLARVLDRNGALAPNPAGYFCARRIHDPKPARKEKS